MGTAHCRGLVYGRLGAVLAALVWTVWLTPGPACAIVLSAGSDTVQVGDVFTIPISIAGATGLTSFQFDLAFTPSIVEVLSFRDTGTDFEAAAISQGGNLTGITGFIDNASGLLSGIADSMSGISGSGLSGAGVLVDIDFEALSPGVSPLTLSNAFLTDGGVPLSSANGDFVLQNGQIVVRGTAAVPEPGTVLILIVALGVVPLLRRPGFLFRLNPACVDCQTTSQPTENLP